MKCEIDANHAIYSLNLLIDAYVSKKDLTEFKKNFEQDFKKLIGCILQRR